MESVPADIRGQEKVPASEIKKRYQSIPTPYTPTLRYPDMVFFLFSMYRCIWGHNTGSPTPFSLWGSTSFMYSVLDPKATQTSIGFCSWNSALVFLIRPPLDLKCTQVKYQLWASCPLKKKRWNIVTVRLFFQKICFPHTSWKCIWGVCRFLHCMHLILPHTPPLCYCLTGTQLTVQMPKHGVAQTARHVWKTRFSQYALWHRTHSHCAMFSPSLHISTWWCFTFDWPHTTEAKACEICRATTNHVAVRRRQPLASHWSSIPTSVSIGGLTTSPSKGNRVRSVLLSTWAHRRPSVNDQSAPAASPETWLTSCEEMRQAVMCPILFLFFFLLMCSFKRLQWVHSQSWTKSSEHKKEVCPKANRMHEEHVTRLYESPALTLFNFAGQHHTRNNLHSAPPPLCFLRMRANSS